MKFTLTRKQWERIGQTAGWKPTDLSNFTDREVPPIYDAQTEEDFLLGPDEPMGTLEERVQSSEDEGFRLGKIDAERKKKGEDFWEQRNPYRTDTEEGIKRFEAWDRGYRRGEGQAVTANTTKTKKTLVAQIDQSARKRQDLVEASALLGKACKIMHLHGETDLSAECIQLNNRLLDRLPRK